MKKKDLIALIEKAKQTLGSLKDETSYGLLSQYILEAERTIREMEEIELSNSQLETYRRLEAAVGPWKDIHLPISFPLSVLRVFFIT